MKKKILIVVANYYKEISKTLVKSTIKKMNNFAKVKIIKVPGVFEIPVTIVKNIKKYHGIIALGCIIKGETPHFDFISKSSINAIMKISVDYRKPIGNGILTCLNMVQAKKRSKKGAEAAEAVKSVLSQ